MPRFAAWLGCLSLLAPLSVGLPLAAMADPSIASASPHHLGLLAGYARHLADLGPSYARPADAVSAYFEPANLRDAVDLGVRYRYAYRPGRELVAEAHRVQASGTDSGRDFWGVYSVPMTHRTEWWGLGVRASNLRGRVRPFLQVSLAYLRESSGENLASLRLDGTNLGMAAASGAEIQVATALSVPIEFSTLFGTAIRDVSAVGLRTGLTWHGSRSPGD